MKSRTLIAGLVAVVVALAAYWYWSPYLAIWQIRNAAQARDAAAFNARVDYPKLRDSMKNQFTPLFMDTPSAADDADAGTGIGKAGAAFGKMLGLIVVDKAVDVLVRPETVMRAMREGYMTPQVPKKGGPAAPPSDAGGANATADAGEKRKVVFERDGVNSLLVYAEHLPDSASDVRIQDKLGFVFERSGFATWKLTGVMLPIHAK